MSEELVIIKRLHFSLKLLERVIDLCYLENDFIPSSYLMEAYSLLLEKIIIDIRKPDFDLIPEEYSVDIEILPDMLPDTIEPVEGEFIDEILEPSLKVIDYLITYYGDSFEKLDSSFLEFIEKIQTLIRDHSTSRVNNSIFMIGNDENKMLVNKLLSFISDEDLKKIIYKEYEQISYYLNNAIYKPVLYSTVSIIEAILKITLEIINKHDNSGDIILDYVDLYKHHKVKPKYKEQIVKWSLYDLIRISSKRGIIDKTLEKTLLSMKGQRNNIHLHNELYIENRITYNDAIYFIGVLLRTTQKITDYLNTEY